MAVPMSEIVRLHASSGTTGKPIVVDIPAGSFGVGRSGGPLSECLRV